SFIGSESDPKLIGDSRELEILSEGGLRLKANHLLRAENELNLVGFLRAAGRSEQGDGEKDAGDPALRATGKSALHKEAWIGSAISESKVSGQGWRFSFSRA